jgi:hypothetical protein
MVKRLTIKVTIKKNKARRSYKLFREKLRKKV